MVASIYNQARYDKTKGRWVGIGKRRTQQSDARSLRRKEKARVEGDPWRVVIDGKGVCSSPILDGSREVFVCCILHCLMAVGRVLTQLITHLAAAVPQSSITIVNSILVAARVNWTIGSSRSIDGEGTHRLFKFWYTIIGHLGLTPGDATDTAVTNMGSLLRRLYKTYQDEDLDLAEDCRSITKDFRINVAEVIGNKSHYLVIMEYDLPRLLPTLFPFNLAMYGQDLSLIHI